MKQKFTYNRQRNQITLIFTLAFFVLSLFAGGYAKAQTAVEPSGTGAPGDPYEIASLENLVWVQENTSSWNAHFKQTANIDLISIANWNPIGNSSTGFEGTYDGNGYAIRNLTIYRPDADDRQGLFGYCGSGSTLKNIRVENVDVRGNEYVGGLAGQTRGIIENSSVTGNVRGSLEYVGGMVGRASDAELDNKLVFIGLVEGGIIADGTSTGVGIGGLVGRSTRETTISVAYVRGIVRGNYAGGLVGSSSTRDSDFSQVYTAVEVGTSRPGQNLGGAVIGRVESSGDVVYNSVYWDEVLFEHAYGLAPHGTLNAIGRTTVQMQGASAEDDYMTNLEWPPGPWRTVTSPEDDYPVFDWQISEVITISGTVTADNADVGGITVTAQVDDATFSDVTTTTDGDGKYSFEVYSGPTRRVFARTTNDYGLPIGATVEGPWSESTSDVDLQLEPRSLTVSSDSDNGWVRDGNEILAVEADAVLNVNTLRDRLLAGDITLVAGMDILFEETFEHPTITNALTLLAGNEINIQENVTIQTDGNIILESDDLDIHADARLKSDKDLFIRPRTAETTIGIAGATGDLQLPESYFDNIFEDGFANIIIGSDDQTGNINANNFTIRQDMTFKSAGDLTIKEDIDLNGHTITLDDRITLNETTGRFFGTTGELTTTRDLNNINAENVAGLGALLTSAADLGETTITRTHASQANLPDGKSVLRTYNISPTNNTGLDATLVFSYNEDELNDLTEEYLTLYSSTDEGASFTQRGGTLDTFNNTITLTGLDSFKKWTAGQGCDNPVSGGEIAADPDTAYDGVEVNIQFTENQPVGTYIGNLQYLWQFTTTSPTVSFDDWSYLGTATTTHTLDYTGILTQTTWFRRLARVECDPDGWASATASNAVEVGLHPPSVNNLDKELGYSSIQDAVDEASEGNTICIGTRPHEEDYEEDVDTSGKGGLTLQAGCNGELSEITITGSLTLSEEDELKMELFDDNVYDKFIIGEDAEINGASLTIKLAGDYSPGTGKRFIIFTSPNDPGEFTQPLIKSDDDHPFILSYEYDEDNEKWNVVLTSLAPLLKLEIHHIESPRGN